MKCLKVARDVVRDKTTKKKRKLCYREVKCDPDGWVDSKRFFPADFDLVFLKTEEKTYPGWAVGNNWDGLNVKQDIKVMYWKRQIDV